METKQVEKINIFTCEDIKDLQKVAFFDNDETRRFDAMLKIVNLNPTDKEDFLSNLKLFIDDNKNINTAHKLSEYITDERLLEVLAINLKNERSSVISCLRLSDIAFAKSIKRFNSVSLTVTYLSQMRIPNSLIEIINDDDYPLFVKEEAVKAFYKIRNNHTPLDFELISREEIYETLFDIGSSHPNWEIRVKALIKIKEVKEAEVIDVYKNETSKELKEKLAPYIPIEFRVCEN